MKKKQFLDTIDVQIRKLLNPFLKPIHLSFYTKLKIEKLQKNQKLLFYVRENYFEIYKKNYGIKLFI